MNQGTAYSKRIKKELMAIHKSGKKICICPMGLVSLLHLRKYRDAGIQADYFYDNNPQLWGTEYEGVVCLSKTELDKIKDNTVMLIEGAYYHELKEQLTSEGFSCFKRVFFLNSAPKRFSAADRDSYEGKIQEVLAICGDERSKEVFRYLTDTWSMDDIPDDYFNRIMDQDQYFDKELIHFDENEVFVDVGAYIGDTWEKFVSKCGGIYEKAHLFELDPHIYRRLMKHVGDIFSGPQGGRGIVQCYPYGISDQCGVVRFTVGDSSSTVISADSQSMEENICLGKCVRLDDVLAGERVTFIKMDIEGAEMSALRGAETLIKQQKPKLAICIYHSPEDMLEIPLYIKSLVPEYKIYIRHYTDLMYETVCYAVAE